MFRRRRLSGKCICTVIIIFPLLIIAVLRYALQRRSPVKAINESDLARHGNATWPQKRIPRIIHQTYRTHEIPEIWNRTVQAVIKMNADEFQYRRWSHEDMVTFVQEKEPDFYRNTYVKYKYDMQRIDSFRYVLLYHIGGIYIDMDSACHRPLREFVATMEALDPDSPYLALFPGVDTFGVQTDFMVGTAGHPLYRQLISRLPLFNHYFLIHHITILLSAGPLFVSFQERDFLQTNQQVVRLLDRNIYRNEFWKTNGGTWFGRDTVIILYLYYNSDRILIYLIKFFILSTILSIAVLLLRWSRNRSFKQLHVPSRDHSGFLNRIKRRLVSYIIKIVNKLAIYHHSSAH